MEKKSKSVQGQNANKSFSFKTKINDIFKKIKSHLFKTKRAHSQKQKIAVSNKIYQKENISNTKKQDYNHSIANKTLVVKKNIPEHIGHLEQISTSKDRVQEVINDHQSLILPQKNLKYYEQLKSQSKPIPSNQNQKKSESEITADSECRQSCIFEIESEPDQQIFEDIKNWQISNQSYKQWDQFSKQLEGEDKESNQIELNSIEDWKQIIQLLNNINQQKQMHESQLVQQIISIQKPESSGYTSDTQRKPANLNHCILKNQSLIQIVDKSFIRQNKKQNILHKSNQFGEQQNYQNSYDENCPSQTNQSVIFYRDKIFQQKFDQFKVDIKKLASVVWSTLEIKNYQSLSVFETDSSDYFKGDSASKMMIISVGIGRYISCLIAKKQNSRKQIWFYMDTNKKFRKIISQIEDKDETRDNQLIYLCDQLQKILNLKVEIVDIQTNQIMKWIKKLKLKSFHKLNLESYLRVQNIFCYRLILTSEDESSNLSLLDSQQ